MSPEQARKLSPGSIIVFTSYNSQPRWAHVLGVATNGAFVRIRFMDHPGKAAAILLPSGEIDLIEEIRDEPVKPVEKVEPPPRPPQGTRASGRYFTPKGWRSWP
jgi:hypothetical protein